MLMPGEWVNGIINYCQYYLFKSYLANVTSFQLNVLIPLCFIGIGVIIGIILSAKVCDYFIKRYKAGFLSFILGLIIASSLVLIPFDASYDLDDDCHL